jgi:uncharacterized phage protein (TIGR02218 family)
MTIRTSQAGILALYDGDGDIRTSQSSVLVLYRESQPVVFSQACVLALASISPCISYRCQCWKITRRDGNVFAFTTHDEPITFQSIEYLPCNSLVASAFEAGVITSGGGVGDAEVNGILADESITEHDLASGLFDGALVEIWQVSWGDVTDTPRRLAKGILGKTTQGGVRYTAEMLSTGAKLSQRPLLDTVTPACRFRLGDGRCPVNLAALEVDSEVTGLLARNALQRNRFRQFVDSSLTEADGYFDFGRLTWTTGDNAGISSEVKSYVAGDNIITLWEIMPNEIQVGDEYTITPGCDGTRTAHTDKFGLTMASFGGFPDIPGFDSMVQTPNARS